MPVTKNSGVYTARVIRRGHSMSYASKDKDEVYEKERSMREDVLVRLSQRRLYFHHDKVMVFYPYSREVFYKKFPDKRPVDETTTKQQNNKTTTKQQQNNNKTTTKQQLKENTT